MRAFTWMLLLALTVACGKAEDGDQGPRGPSGETPKPLPGQPGRDAVTKEINCSVKWELEGQPAGRYYDVMYVVMRLAAESTFAGLRTTYFVGGQSVLDTEQTVIYPKASGKAQTSPIKTTLWEAELISDEKALITKQPGNIEEEVTCK